MRKANLPFITIKLTPALSASQALKKVEEVLNKYDPGGSFNFKFVDVEFGLKFWREERIANLAIVFSVMAIFISLLGIFGLASFVAEQRTKEIGVRKVLGAGVLNLWGLLSKDFVVLVILAFLIATPIAHFFMSNWLLNYEYRTELSWWIFVAAGLGALAITLLTVSYQAIRTALANPVKSLRSE
jgi:ABC-type antimicrobial peptide transport system permease subunit